MVSLLKLAKVTEEGVRFLSPHDGTPMYAVLPFPNLQVFAPTAEPLEAAHTRTLDIAPKHHRFRHNHAARRRHRSHISRRRKDERSNGAIDPMAGPLHHGAQEPREAESLLHHPGRPGSGIEKSLLRGNGQEGHTGHRYRWLIGRRGQGVVLSSVSAA